MTSLEPPLDERSKALRDELVHLIESHRHIVLGAKATMFYTRPRYTADVDYAVGARDFSTIRKWFHDKGVAHEFNGKAIQCQALGIDVIDASRNAIIETVLSIETGITGIEAVAALKYAAAISPTRPYERKRQDAADFAALVRREGFDNAKFLGLFVGPFQAERGTAERILTDVQAGRPCAL